MISVYDKDFMENMESYMEEISKGTASLLVTRENNKKCCIAFRRCVSKYAGKYAYPGEQNKL